MTAISENMDAQESPGRDFQLNHPITAMNGSRVKSPFFDGTIPFYDFKLVFEKATEGNNWRIDEKSAALFHAFKGPAAEILVILDYKMDIIIMTL